jgi:hypothetical protein
VRISGCVFYCIKLEASTGLVVQDSFSSICLASLVSLLNLFSSAAEPVCLVLK